MYLDQLLSDRRHEYTCRDLVIKVDEMMRFDGFGSIYNGDPEDKVSLASGKRLIQMDVVALKDSPFNMDIDSSEKRDGAPIYRYADPTHNLFSKQLTDDEKLLLREVLNTLGCFSGLDSFEWLDELRNRLCDKRSFGNANPLARRTFAEIDRKEIMSFEENKYLRNKEYLPQIFSSIAGRQTICVTYKKFNESNSFKIIVYPYMLKQYTTRWYLICTPASSEKKEYNPELVLTLPIDRFEGEVSVCNDVPFIGCAVDLEERFEEIIGISYSEENPVEKIILAVRDDCFPFIDTKPLHETQKRFKDDQYQMRGYQTISIECRYNYELLSKLYSYGDELVVLYPPQLREKIVDRLKAQLKLYK